MKVFYDNDASLEVLKGKKIGIIGYGIQGRAQALNLRDSGVDVIIGNRKDKYNNKAIDDGFEVKSIEEVASESSIILFLIPDQAQKEIYDTYIKKYLKYSYLLNF